MMHVRTAGGGMVAVVEGQAKVSAEYDGEEQRNRPVVLHLEPSCHANGTRISFYWQIYKKKTK